ncbi:MAG: TonB-dependent siderophore receptor [Opitutaceae bacterium]|nr:TonB-dependent siderophore receptor [Opitutaceae bacterium]
MNTHPRLLLALAAAGASLLAQTPAATSTAAADAKNLPAVTLESFNVSGKKVQSYQAESVQLGAYRDVDPVDVPLTINVLTREVLDAQAARGLHDALKNTAGVTRAQITGSVYDNLAIRGILIENRGNYRLNGSLPIINLADISMENKERVEVLKGTSSLYYGFIPPSGVINLVTKRATATPVTTFTLTANSAGGYGGALDVSRRFAPGNAVGLRLNLAASSEETGLDNYEGDRQFAALAGDWRITERLIVRADFERLDKNVTEQSAIALPTAVAGVVTPPPVPSTKHNVGGEWARYDATMTNWWARADFIINPQWTVFVEAGNAHTNRDRIYSPFTFAAPQATSIGSTGNGNVSVQFFPGQDYRNKNYRAETFGRFLTGGLRHDVSLGVTSNTRRANAPSRGTVAVPQNYYRPAVLAPVSPTTNVITQVPSRIRDHGYYVSDRISAFEERLQAIAGVRSTDYTSTTATTNYDISGRTNPFYSLVFKPTRNTSVYGSYLKGLEAGGNAPANTANAGSILPPLTSTQKEVGAKAKLFGGLLAQLGLYEIERPSTFIDPATNRFVPNGLARFRGLELFLSGELTKELSLVGSLQNLDARQVKALNATTLNKNPENTARYTGSLFAEWRTPVANLAASAGAYYTGRRALNNTNQGFIGGYTTYSAGVSYRTKFGDYPLTIRVNGDNLANKNAWAAAGSNLLGVTAPRLLKLTLTAAY